MFWRSWQELSKQELYDLLQLRLSVFSVEQDCPYQDCDALDQQAMHLLAYQDEVLVGYLRVFESLDKYQGQASVGRVCTLGDVRQTGLGKNLMQAAMLYCDKHYKKTVVISAQSYLEDFYKSFGFQINSQLYLEDGIEHIQMIRFFSGEK